MNRHTTFYVKDIKNIDSCGKTIGWNLDLDGAFELPFEITPTIGEHDFNTCNGCQTNLKEITENLTKLFVGNKQKKGFPFCCSYHSNLVSIKEFSRENFIGAPEMVAKKIIYTNQHVINNLDHENWYKVITDYIDWVVESFGQMPTKCGERLYLSNYFKIVSSMLNRNKKIPIDKKGKILEFIKSFYKENTNESTDWNVLIATYQKWINIFPFEVNSYFGNLKAHYEKKLPILADVPEKNIYSGLAKATIHTKESLGESLLQLTDNLLTQINGANLYEQGLITDSNKIKLELIINERKQKLKTGYRKENLDDGKQYQYLIKGWFHDEKKFIDEITPLLIIDPIIVNQSKSQKLKTELIKLGFLSIATVNTLPPENQDKLIDKLNINDLPYKIAMLDYLGFTKYLEKEQCKTKSKTYTLLAITLDTTFRAVKGNFNVLNDYSKEDRTRYTAHLHKEIVEKDYQTLK